MWVAMAQEKASIRLRLISEIKEYITRNPSSVIGPSYHAMNKQIADLYLGLNEELKAIYHLTEAHAATLRLQTVTKYDFKADAIKNPNKNTKPLPVAQGIQKKYVEFDSEIAAQEENGLLARLREMPKEWTVVQLTRQAEPEARFRIRPKGAVTLPTCLNITRLPCGSALDEESPVSVMVAPPRSSEGMPTIFELMRTATHDCLKTKETRPRLVHTIREKAAEHIKEVTEVLASGYLREWRCLLLGSLRRSQYSEQVKSCIDQVLSTDKHKSYNLDKRSRLLLMQVVDGAVNLTNAEIRSAVAYIVDSRELEVDLVTAIEKFKDDMSILLAARRNPVILIVDEGLDLLPWEMIPILKKHPVSRIPSIHFLHALYHEHKEHIVDGCRIVNRVDVGFYVVNPDEDLKQMEKRLMSFLEKRMPEWKGVTGQRPSEDQFCNALVDNKLFLYCGHFNGTHIFGPDNISNLRVVALPLLFGCASVALQELGGHTHPTGVSDSYIMAGSACVLGMLWTVTSDDTDCMSVILLNSWLPGAPVDLTSFRRAGDMLTPAQEPELLRLMKYAREAAHLFSNAAALIARGIPIKMADE